MNKFNFLAALAVLAVGHQSILGVSLQAPAATSAAGTLSMGNTPFGQIANQNVTTAVYSRVNVAARGLAGVVPVMTMSKLDRASNGVIASTPFPSAARQQTTEQIPIMETKNKVVGPSKTNIVKSVNFSLKKRPALPMKGLHNAVIVEVLKETGNETYTEINRIRVPVVLDEKDSNGNSYLLDKTYNIGENGRGLNSLLQDYFAWSGIRIAKDDIFTFDCPAAMNGQPVVVEVGYHINGSKVTAFIKAFYPAGTVEAVAAAQA